MSGSFQNTLKWMKTNELTKPLAKQELVVETAAKIPKTILMYSETLLRKAFSGIVQIDTEENRPFPDSDAGMFWWTLKSHTAFALSQKFDEQVFIRESLLRKSSIET